MTEWKDDPASHEEHHGYDEYDAPRNTTGNVLFYFFAVVVLCAISLGVGYMMGKRSAPQAPDNAQTSQSAPVSGAPKPTASRNEETPAIETSAPETESAAPETHAATTPTPAPVQKRSSKAAAKTPEMNTSAAKGFMVQVAAVTRQEDADTLAGALRKKKYPVFVLPPAGSDKFYHVQVGPFAELKDADAMKSKLAGDGYNAIVKK